MLRQVPAFPVVACVGVVAFGISVWFLHRRHLLSAPRASVALALAVYVAGVVANTIFPIFLDGVDDGRPWTAGIALVPFSDYEVRDALMNVLVFLPLGALTPIVLGTSSPGRVVIVAAAISLTIEVLQYLSGRLLNGGHISDVNDLIFNAIGGALGFGLLRVLSRVPAFAATVDQLRWQDQRPR